MDKNEIFWELVKYHIEHNWETLNGKYHGTTLIANKDHSIDDLVEKAVITIPDKSKTVRIDNKENLRDYLEENGQKDGAHIYLRQTITPVAMGENYVKKINEMGSDFYSLFPKDFVSPDCSISVREGIGTRTRAALVIPQVNEDLHTYIVRKRPYGSSKMGKVAYMNIHGLMKEFFFLNSPLEYTVENAKGDIKIEILGKYRKYLENRDKSIFEQYYVCRKLKSGSRGLSSLYFLTLINPSLPEKEYSPNLEQAVLI
ncbi:MAG: hypothetical protein KAK00_05765 [Nanoarchaeota archaeon]|nr:hypothetical protein [Nanoarchaeota archaeon]